MLLPPEFAAIPAIYVVNFYAKNNFCAARFLLPSLRRFRAEKHAWQRDTARTTKNGGVAPAVSPRCKCCQLRPS
jgi:hypothetical protein